MSLFTTALPMLLILSSFIASEAVPFGQGECNTLIQHLFKFTDTNRDDLVTQNEVEIFFNMIDNTDTSDGIASQKEFALWWKMLTGMGPTSTKVYFMLADIDLNGLVEKAETFTVFKRWDKDGNGFVTWTEFMCKWHSACCASGLLGWMLEEYGSTKVAKGISKAQFVKGASAVLNADASNEARLCLFQALDENKDNQVAISEIESKYDSVDKIGVDRTSVLQLTQIYDHLQEDDQC